MSAVRISVLELIGVVLTAYSSLFVHAAHASHVLEGVPTVLSATGIIGDETYQLRVTQSVDEDYVTHIDSFSLTIGRRTFAMPMERLRLLANPQPGAVVIRSYRESLPQKDAGSGEIHVGGVGRISVGVPFEAQTCLDPNGNSSEYVEGRFIVIFSESGHVQSVEESGACAECSLQGLACDRE